MMLEFTPTEITQDSAGVILRGPTPAWLHGLPRGITYPKGETIVAAGTTWRIISITSAHPDIPYAEGETIEIRVEYVVA